MCSGDGTCRRRMSVGRTASRELVEAILDPAREEVRAMFDWYGGPFDPCGFDEAQAHFGQENMARRRRGPRASHSSESWRPKR